MARFTGCNGLGLLWLHVTPRKLGRRVQRQEMFCAVPYSEYSVRYRCTVSLVPITCLANEAAVDIASLEGSVNSACACHGQITMRLTAVLGADHLEGVHHIPLRWGNRRLHGGEHLPLARLHAKHLLLFQGQLPCMLGLDWRGVLEQVAKTLSYWQICRILARPDALRVPVTHDGTKQTPERYPGPCACKCSRMKGA